MDRGAWSLGSGIGGYGPRPIDQASMTVQVCMMWIGLSAGVRAYGLGVDKDSKAFMWSKL